MKRAALIIASIFGVLLLVIAVALFALTTPYFAAKISAYVGHKTGREVAVARGIEWHLWSRTPGVVLYGVRVSNADWSKEPDMFKADRIACFVRLRGLLHLRLEIHELALDAPRLVLEKNAQGASNWQFSENPSTAVLKQAVPETRSQMPLVEHLTIHEGSFTYRDPQKAIDTTLHIDSVNADGASDRLTLKGDGTYRHAPFFLEASGASLLQLRDEKAPYPFTFTTRLGDTVIHAHGSVQDPVQMEALHVTLDLRGKDAASLYAFTGIALPPTPPYHVAGLLTRSGKRWQFEQIRGTLGASDLKGDILWDTSPAIPYFKGDFVSSNLDMRDLSGLIGAHKKPDDDNRVLPDAPLDISRLLAMNADVSFHGLHIKTPNLLNDVVIHIHLKNGTLNADPITFDLAHGSIKLSLTIQGKETPPGVAANVTFQRLSLADLFAPLAARYGKDNVSAGVLGGKASLKGAGASLRTMLGHADGTIGFGMEGGKLSHLLLDLAGLDIFRSAGLLVTGDEPVDMNCVVGDFQVEHGVMRPEALLIETKVSTIDGQGSLSLGDETMNLRFRVHPKEATLFSARSPLLLRGTFKHPRPGVDATALAERGAAAGLLALLAPPAALLAFIDPGLGENSNCASFITKMQHDTGGRVPKPAH